ncbi:alginate lyase family protein [Candidatus Poribacteria bacterium]
MKLLFTIPLLIFSIVISPTSTVRSLILQVWAEITDLEENRMDKPVSKIKEEELPQHPRLLFSQEGVEKLKERISSYDWAEARWNGIKESSDRMLDKPVELPPRGGNWWHWYACPDHGAALRTGKQTGKWQWEHICPVDDKVFLGDPDRPDRDYDGCVISGSHNRLSRAVLDLGTAYQLTGDSRYAQKAREILLAYADMYLSYPLHTTRGEEKIGGGRVGPQTLDESTWLIPVCQGADLIWDELSEDDKSTIAQKMLLPAAKEVILPHKMRVHNIQCWKNSAVGLVGFLLGDEELINEAIHNPDRGYWTQIRNGVLPDGIWWEGAWGYHFYTLSALWGLTEAAYNCGVDLYCDELKSMFDGPIRFAMPNLRLPAFNDSGEVNLKGRASIYELAFARYQEPLYVNLISTSNRRDDFALRFGVGELPPESPVRWESVNYPESGYAILACGEGEQATWLCMKYGPHGGGHGHPDKLNFVLYSGGELIAPDSGTARYGVPIQGGWYKTTLSHNTLIVDETAQRPADGKCLAFGSEDGVDYVVAEAGGIYDGVRFTRSVALIDNALALFIDQIRCDGEHLLDVAYHNRGTWESLPDGEDWTPPDKPGYQYLRDATIREVQGGIDLSIQMAGGQRKSISIAADETLQVITATGLEKHTADRVPVVILRRHAKETAFVWCVGLDGKAAQVKFLTVQDSDGNLLPSAIAAAVQVESAGTQRRIIIANPDGLLLNIELPDGTEYQIAEVFDIQ